MDIFIENTKQWKNDQHTKKDKMLTLITFHSFINAKFNTKPATSKVFLYFFFFNK